VVEFLERLSSDYARAVVVALAVAGVLLVLRLAVALRKRREPPRAARTRWELVATALLAALMLCVAVLAGTGFWGVLAQGALHHWGLMAHTFAGGTFAALLAVFALVGARRARGAAAGVRIAFWLTLATGTVAAGSVLVSTLPVFGTEDLERLLVVHRWSGLALVLVVCTRSVFSLFRPLGANLSRSGLDG
jgi:hypothetical protein